MRAITIIFLISALFSEETTEYKPIIGDILIQSFPNSPLTKAIESCTGSVYSHCSIVINTGDVPKVFEAVGPVKETTMKDWIGNGRNGNFMALRLKDKYTAGIPKFIESAMKFKGRPYDMHMDMDDQKIYCSELIYKAFKSAFEEEIGVPQKLSELNWKPNEKFIRLIEKGNLPLERYMITPLAIVNSDKLTVIFSNFKEALRFKCEVQH